MKKSLTIFACILFMNVALLKSQTIIAAFGINGYGIIGGTTCFYDSSTCLPTTHIASRKWNFGDGTGTFTVSPTTTITTHVFSSPGTFMVKLVVKDSIGNLDSLTKPVLIKNVKMPQLSIYQVDTDIIHNSYTVSIGAGSFYTNQTTFCDDTTNYTNYAPIAYRKWKFYDPATSPGDTSLLANATHVYTTPVHIRIVYYYAFYNPAGTCGSGGGGLQLDSIVTTGNGPCYDMMQGPKPSPQVFTANITPVNNSNPICPTDSFVMQVYYPPAYIDQCSNMYGGNWGNIYMSYTDPNSGSNNTTTTIPVPYIGSAATITFTVNLSNPGTYSFNGVGGMNSGNAYEYSNGPIIQVNNCSAGIDRITSSNNVSIYPNPNNGAFVIEQNSAKKQTMQVYDVTGKMVLTQTITGKTTIDASSLGEGVYNVSLISNDGIVNKRLIIVR